MSMRGGRGAYGYDDAPPARDGYATRGAREGGGGGRGAYNGGGGNDFQPDQDARGSSFIYRSGGTGGRGAFSNGGDDFRSQDRDSYENRDSFAQRGGSSMRGGRGGGEFGGGGARDSFGNHGGGYDERPPERSEFSTGGGGRGGASAGRGAYDRNDSFDQRGPPQGGRGGGSIFPNDRPPRNDYAEQDRYAPSGGRGGSQNFGNDRSNGYSGGGGRGDGGYESNDRAFEDYGKGTNKTPLNTNSEHSTFGGRGQDNRQQYEDRGDSFNDNRGMSNGRGGGNTGGRSDFQSEFSTGGRGGGRSGGDYGRQDSNDNQQGGFRGGGQSFGQRGGGPGRGGFNNGGDFHDGNRDAYGQDSFRGGGAPRGGRGGGPVGRGEYGQNDSFGPSRGGRGGGGNFGGDDGGFSGGRGGGAPRGGGYGQSDGGFAGRGGRGGGGSFRGGHSDGFGDQDNEGQFGGGGFQGGRGGGQGGGSRGCFNCGQEGHMSRDCPNPRDESRRPMGGGGGGPCYNCGQEGHMSRECPNGNNGLFRQQRPMEDRGPIRPAHCPVERGIDAIFDDDKERQQGAQLYDLDGQVEVDPLPEPLCVFEEWSDTPFNEIIIENIKRSGYERPRNFQKYAMPLILEGHDVKGQAETGSGKSAAFLLPIIHKLHEEFDGKNKVERLHECAALIIEPTRELAIQLTEQARKFAHGELPSFFFRTSVSVNSAYGEYKISQNKNKIHLEGCDILIGTPGRLKHFMGPVEKFIKYTNLKYLVLDEADRLLDSSFMMDIDDIVRLENFPTDKQRQTLFFSATFPPQICDLASTFCKPESYLIKNKNNDLNQRIEQEIFEVPVDDRKTFLFDYLEKLKEQNNGEMPKTLMFVETKRDADTLAFAINEKGTPAQTVHSDRTQQQREDATRAFREGILRALVSTNVFSRGLDIRDLDHVINVHLPDDRDTYVHRIGRTGRLQTGKATTFFDPMHPNDREMAQTIVDELTKAGQEVPEFLSKATEPLPFEYATVNPDGTPNDAAAEVEEPEFD